MTPRKVLRAGSRRQEYSSSTRRALMESATELFTEGGYAGTSLDDIVAAARVTKGALYHHYSGKLDLFEHVVQQITKDATRSVSRELRRHRDPWERAEVAVSRFLQICQEPTYRRIVMQEAPVALGSDRFAEIERVAAFGLVEKVVKELLSDQSVDPGLRDAFAAIFYGALRAAGTYVADAEDPERSQEEVETVIGSVLLGLRNFGGLGAPVAATTDEVTS